ncbi:hypothetical protein MKEN_00006500 [Mycena kentingensis (nom. inval.)]|nr:hypothetical protein MKEN_00006500 [Mycena kentingensis (nom. inval.)]
MRIRLPLSLPFLLPLVSLVSAQDAGSFEVVANTRVSAMMMFVGNEDKVYILDKAQGNAETIKGHPAWGSVWDMKTNKVELMDILSNTFCSSGMHLPNGSFTSFGGNHAVRIGGDDPDSSHWDTKLQDFDGNRSIRILSPCLSTDDFTQPACQWYEDADSPALTMQAERWYSTAEPLGDGTIVLMGGFTTGGFVLRILPNRDPTIGGSLNYEYFPNTRNKALQDLQFLFKTSALNAYPHAYLMASGKIFLQANTSTALWDHEANVEEALPDMPNGVVRVYPASGATAMLPMTPANNYAQTILFCGGSDIPDTNNEWGNFSWPFVNTWEHPASTDCQRITPEGDAKYHTDDPLPIGRTMGQFIILPTGHLLVVNGGSNGTAGYGRQTLLTPLEADMPFQQSFASGSVGTPALYDPGAPTGARWSTAGFATTDIARLYHSTALLLPDASVLLAGSNPNLDVNTTNLVTFPTEYRAEKFYPGYFAAKTRPRPSGVPSKLNYGGEAFDVVVHARDYEGSANDAAGSAMVNIVRPGWTTHGMNMGQRFLQLNNTYTVADDGTITLHVAQMPPNPNLFQPGPAFIFVVVNGIPSNGTYTIVGSGEIGAQPVADATVLPASVLAADDAKGSAQSSDGDASGSDTGTGSNADKSWISRHAALVAGVAGSVAAIGALGLVLGICLARRRRTKLRAGIAAGKARFADSLDAEPYRDADAYAPVPPRSPGTGGAAYPHDSRATDSRVFLAHQGSPRGSSVWQEPQVTEYKPKIQY